MRSKDRARSRAHDAAASPTRDESLELAFLSLAYDQEIGATITRKTNELEIGLADDDMTTRAPNQLTEHRRANLSYALELATNIEMHRGI